MIIRLEPIPSAAARMMSDESIALIELADQLANERFAGRAAGYDAAAEFPKENYADLRDAGLLTLRVPAEYGGPEVDPLTYAMCILAVARGCPSTALTLAMHTNVLGSFVGGLGTPEQRNWYFREAVDDGQLFASITSEPGASARERFVLSTIFTPEAGGGYRVTGTKHFCSLADAADYFFVTGIIAGSGGGSDNIVSAMIRSDMSGVAVTEQWDAVGMRATSSHTVSYNTVAPVHAIFGPPGRILSADWGSFSLGYAAVYLGIAEAAYGYITDYVSEKSWTPEGGAIINHPSTQRAIGEMSVAIQSGRLLVVDAALTDRNTDPTGAVLAVNRAKQYCAEVGVSVTDAAMRLAGGGGLLKSSPLERLRRDALSGPVASGLGARFRETRHLTGFT
ncbi:MAG: acyl-CoA/acyl-ACP dehydrogenase, partial [Chloroflexi bacterium]|nr:acyl-CoA/acyl-ACP dehydrogenase [Chloroflexota bacterium]